MTPNRETSFWHIGMVLILAAVVGYYTWDSANTIPEQVPVQIKATAVDKVEATTSRITLPRLENYPDKVIQNKVNAAIAAYEGNLGCYAGETLPELRDSLAFQSKNRNDGLFSSTTVNSLTKGQLMAGLQSYSYWNTKSKVTKNGDGIFSINIHSEYDCNGPYPTNDNNQSITFDLSTGKKVEFPTLFSDWQRDASKILAIAFAEEIKAAPRVIESGQCPNDLDSFVSLPEYSYSVSTSSIIIQQDLPHVAEVCSFEKEVPIAKLKAFINPKGILGKLVVK